MKKFIAFMGISWQQTLIYRAEHIVWFLMDLFPALIISNFWVYSLRTGHIKMSDFSLVIYYYIINIFLERTTASHFEDWMVDEVKDGRISTYLLKPLSYRLYLTANELSWRISGLTFVLPSLLLFIPFVRLTSFPQISVFHFLIFITMIPLIFLQRFSLSFLIGITSFWLSNSKALSHFKWMCEGLFGGAWLPLFLFPKIFLQIASFTPFYYWFYFPNQLLLGKFSDSQIISGLLIFILFSVFLYLFSNYSWRIAVKSYSANGS